MEMDSSFRFGTCHFGNLKREVSLTFLFQIRIIRKKQKGCPFGGFLYDRWLVKANLDHKNGGEKNHAFDFPPKQHPDRLRPDSASRTGKKISSFNMSGFIPHFQKIPKLGWKAPFAPGEQDFRCKVCVRDGAGL